MSELEHRAEDAGDATERCGLYAAIVRAGDHDKAYALHHALTEAPDVSSLPSIWKLEILDALRIVNILTEGLSRSGEMLLKWANGNCNSLMRW